MSKSLRKSIKLALSYLEEDAVVSAMFVLQEALASRPDTAESQRSFIERLVGTAASNVKGDL